MKRKDGGGGITYTAGILFFFDSSLATQYETIIKLYF